MNGEARASSFKCQQAASLLDLRRASPPRQLLGGIRRSSVSDDPSSLSREREEERMNWAVGCQER
jgi:hypothetical protein